MAVESREDIIARLERSVVRMARVRRAAQLASIVRAGDEPAPTPRLGELGPPGPDFSGQPPRPGSPTG